MRLSKHTDHGVRVPIHLTVDPGRLSTIKEIATRFDISRARAVAGFMTMAHGCGCRLNDVPARAWMRMRMLDDVTPVEVTRDDLSLAGPPGARTT
jgi:hypothetical protein